MHQHRHETIHTRLSESRTDRAGLALADLELPVTTVLPASLDVRFGEYFPGRGQRGRRGVIGVGGLLIGLVDAVVLAHPRGTQISLQTRVKGGRRPSAGCWCVSMTGPGDCPVDQLRGNDGELGADIVRVALEAPLKQIAINAGLEGGVVVEKVRGLPAGHGLNAATGEYEDLIKAGIIDPAKVTRSALQNAASITGLFLTTEAVIVDKPEREKAPAGGIPDGGGMDF